jgi:uracil phosphoribosyltransferase
VRAWATSASTAIRARSSPSNAISSCRALQERDAIVLDPMLATGNSAVAAVERLKETRPRSIRMVCLVACPEGIRTFQDATPTCRSTGAIDRQLDEHGYILRAQ